MVSEHLTIPASGPPIIGAGPIVIRRERTPELCNHISNLPGVWENIARHGKPMDWEEACRHCVVYSNGVDAFQAFEQTAERDWQVITVFGPECRGKRALETARAIKAKVEPHADLIFGSIPNRLRAAMWFYTQLGGERVESVTSGGETYVAQPDETLFAFRPRTH